MTRFTRWLLRGSVFALALVAIGCAPIVDVGGVYFPGWLISAIGGIVIAYAVVAGLSRSGATRVLSESGLFFVGLATLVALSAWWLIFRGF